MQRSDVILEKNRDAVQRPSRALSFSLEVELPCLRKSTRICLYDCAKDGTLQIYLFDPCEIRLHAYISALILIRAHDQP